MIYEKEFELTLQVRIRGNIEYEDGTVGAFAPDGSYKDYQVSDSGYFHDDYNLIELYDKTKDEYVPVPSNLAEIFYRVFMKEFPADKLVEELEVEPDYEPYDVD